MKTLVLLLLMTPALVDARWPAGQPYELWNGSFTGPKLQTGTQKLTCQVQNALTSFPGAQDARTRLVGLCGPLVGTGLGHKHALVVVPPGHYGHSTICRRFRRPTKGLGPFDRLARPCCEVTINTMHFVPIPHGYDTADFFAGTVICRHHVIGTFWLSPCGASATCCVPIAPCSPTGAFVVSGG